jgi:hypothetical protein
MESPIKVIGNKPNDKVMEYKSGQMDQNIKVNLKIIKPMEKELFIIQMEIYTKGIG